jgi:broad specificity phosphatase PhoE
VKLFLIRHGQSMGNLTGDYSTNQHDNLSEKGRKQAEDLALRLIEAPIYSHVSRIFSSPLGRAKQTIIPFLKKQKMKAEIWPDLAESCWQEDHDQPLSNPELAYHSFPLEKGEEAYFYSPDGKEIMAPSENETFQDGLRRMKRVSRRLTEICSEKKGDILVICHAWSISKLLVLLRGEGDIDGKADLENTSVTPLVYNQKTGLFESM